MKYTDYYELNDSDDEVSMDMFIAESMRTDLTFPNVSSELAYLKSSRVTLINELFTCYEFLKESNLLSTYHIYRDGF